MGDRRTGLFLHAAFLSVALFLSIVLTHTVLLSFLKRSQISSIETAVRENILLDNRREVIALLDQATRLGFESIFLSHYPHKNIIFFGRKKPVWWELPIEKKLFFDSKQVFESSRLVFYYSPFEGWWISFSVWIVASLLAIAPVKIFLDRKKLALQKEEESKKNKVALEIFNYLAHDMRAPVGIFEKLLFVDPDSRIGDFRLEISQSINRLYAMVESIRYSNIDVAVKPIESTLDFEFGFVSLSEKAKIRNIAFSVPEKNESKFKIDSRKFERAWMNLAANAIDIAQSVVRVDFEAQGADLILRVIDDGPGVPDEFLPKLFKRGATHGKPDGTGLGLAYVRQIMRGHGGDVTYRRENGFTIFECRLPNAVEPEKGQVVENAMSLEIQLLQKQVRVVAICLEPESLSRAVRTKLASYKSDDEFFFVEERQEANIVVSNVEDIMIEVLEADDKEFVAVGQYKGDEDRIVDILKRKFNLA